MTLEASDGSTRRVAPGPAPTDAVRVVTRCAARADGTATVAGLPRARAVQDDDGEACVLAGIMLVLHQSTAFGAGEPRLSGVAEGATRSTLDLSRLPGGAPPEVLGLVAAGGARGCSSGRGRPSPALTWISRPAPTSG